MGADTLLIPLDTHLLPAMIHLQPPVPEVEFYNLDTVMVRGKQAAEISPAQIPHLRPSVFSITEHKGHAPDPVRSPVDPFSRSFTGSVLLLIFLLIVVLRWLAPRKAVQYLMAVFSQKSFQKFMAEEEPSWLPPMPLLLGAVSLLTGAALSAVWLDPSGFSSPFFYFLTGTGIILAAYLLPILRAAALRVLGGVLRIQDYSRLHINFSYLSQVLFAFLLVPVFLCYALGLGPRGTWMAMAVTAAFLVVFFYHFFRLLWQFRSAGWFSVLNFFLYFCTLEIVPLLLLYKCYRIMEWE